MHGLSKDAQLQTSVNTSCWLKEICTLSDVIEITNGQPWQNSSQTSVFWRGTECHCQVSEFLLHNYRKMINSEFRASNTLLNMP
jgi:hypothetical protein